MSLPELSPSLGLLLVAGLLSLFWLVSRNMNRRSRIDLDDLIVGDDGKASKAAFVMFGALGVTSWIVITMTHDKTMTGEIFAAYIAGWVAPAVTKLIVDGGVKKAAVSGSSDTNIAQQVVVTPAEPDAPTKRKRQ